MHYPNQDNMDFGLEEALQLPVPGCTWKVSLKYAKVVCERDHHLAYLFQPIQAFLDLVVSTSLAYIIRALRVKYQ